MFSSLDASIANLLNEILARRSPALLERIRRADSLTHADAQEVMSTIADEFTENLDENWEPTAYGQRVGAVLAQFNAACLNKWP